MLPLCSELSPLKLTLSAVSTPKFVFPARRFLPLLRSTTRPASRIRDDTAAEQGRGQQDARAVYVK